MQSRHGLIHLGRQSKLLLHGSLRALGPWIDRQMQRRRLRLAAHSYFHLIITRRSERSSRSDAGVKRTGYLNRIIVAQVPRETVHPLICGNCFWPLDAIRPFRRLFAFFFLFAGKMPEEFSGRVQNIERDFLFWRSLQIIINDRARWRVIADWLALIEFLLFPRSVFLKMYGLKSSSLCRSTATYAALASCGE